MFLGTKPGGVSDAANSMPEINLPASGVTRIRDNLPSDKILQKKLHGVEYDQLHTVTSDILWKSTRLISGKDLSYPFSIGCYLGSLLAPEKG